MKSGEREWKRVKEGNDDARYTEEKGSDPVFWNGSISPLGQVSWVVCWWCLLRRLTRLSLTLSHTHLRRRNIEFTLQVCNIRNCNFCSHIQWEQKTHEPTLPNNQACAPLLKCNVSWINRDFNLIIRIKFVYFVLHFHYLNGREHVLPFCNRFLSI